VAGCVPKAAQLTGATVAPARLPTSGLARRHQTVSFTWAYQDVDLRASGEGAARVAPPDSVRLDLFLAAGLGGGRALVLGDSLLLPPSGGMIKRFLPPVAMFWAALGRLAVPPGDTSVRVDGTRTRADIARGNDVMRVTFDGDRLSILERIGDGGIQERVTRGATITEYEHLGARRKLTLVITRTADAGAFDASIWQR
jgi:hypothetical protein